MTCPKTMFVVKITHTGDQSMRRLLIEEPYSFAELCRVIKTRFELSEANSSLCSLQYRDPEGDMISLNSDVELAEALSLLSAADAPVLHMSLCVGAAAGGASWAAFLSSDAVAAEDIAAVSVKAHCPHCPRGRDGTPPVPIRTRTPARTDPSSLVDQGEPPAPEPFEAQVDGTAAAAAAMSNERKPSDQVEDDDVVLVSADDDVEEERRRAEEERETAAALAEVAALEERERAAKEEEAAQVIKRHQELAEQRRCERDAEEARLAAEAEAEERTREEEEEAAARAAAAAAAEKRRREEEEEEAKRGDEAKTGADREKFELEEREKLARIAIAVAQARDQASFLAAQLLAVGCDAATVSTIFAAGIVEAASGHAEVGSIVTELVGSAVGGAQQEQAPPQPEEDKEEDNQEDKEEDKAEKEEEPKEEDKEEEREEERFEDAQEEPEGGKDANDLAAMLIAFYQEHNPQGIDNVARLVGDFGYDVAGLNRLLFNKYGQDLTTVSLASQLVSVEQPREVSLLGGRHPVEESAAAAVVVAPQEEQVMTEEELEAMSNMVEMGLEDIGANIEALRRHGGDVARAIDELFEA